MYQKKWHMLLCQFIEHDRTTLNVYKIKTRINKTNILSATKLIFHYDHISIILRLTAELVFNLTI